MSAAFAPTAPGRATIADLEGIAEKAELINGKIVRLMPTGDQPGYIGGRIYRKLADHVDALGHGRVWPDGVGFAVSELTSGRQSFAPDTAFVGVRPGNPPLKFVTGPPDFAVEVRSENDTGAAAERDMSDKRADYFEAGTSVVWDVDPVAEIIRSFRRDDPQHPTIFHRGQIADAEPAVPGWRLDTEWLFR